MTDFNLTPADHLGAVTRDLRDGERDGHPLRVLVVQRDFAAARLEVWDALTTRERIPRWFAPVTGDLQLGGRYQIEGNAGGEVLACEEPAGFEITWEYDGQLSWVEVMLSEIGSGCRLRLEHSAPVSPQMWEQFGPGAVGMGWEMMLMGLAEHFASPDFSAAEAQATMTTPDGMAWIGQVMAGSSSAWGTADAAFGTDPARASAAAGRCLAAYTGQDPAESDTTGGASQGGS